MQIQTSQQISTLKPVEKDALLAEMTKILAAQGQENLNLKALTAKANQINTLWKTVTTIVGLVVGIGVATLFFGGVWSDWGQIKNSHEFTNTRSGAVLYDHQKLHTSEISAFRSALGLPDDFSEFAKKSDLPIETDLSSYLRHGDAIVLKTYGNKGYSIESNTGDFRDKQIFTGKSDPNSVHQVFYVDKSRLR